MDPRTDVILEEIHDTRQNLAEDLATLEGKVRDTVSEARRKVEDVKEKILDMSPLEQARQRPWVAVGASVAAGVATGFLVHRGGKGIATAAASYAATRYAPEAATPRRSFLAPALKGAFSAEWGMLKGILAGVAVEQVGRLVQDALPTHRDKIEETVSRIVTKLDELKDSIPAEAKEKPL